MSSVSLSEYKGIDILKGTEIAFRNIKDCIESNKDFNYIEITKTSNNYYQITRSMFCLKRIMETFDLESKFKSLYDNLLHSLSMKMKFGKVSNDERKFVYKILNSMMIYTISNNDIWFLESLRDGSFESKFISLTDRNYFTFVCIYIYYICKIDKTVEEDVKKKLEDFIISQCKGLNSEKSDNIVSIFNFNQTHGSFRETANSIKELLMMFDSQEGRDIWYEPPFVRSWTSANGSFDKELIFNCWLILLFTSEGFWNMDFNQVKEVIDSLNDENKEILLNVVNRYWVENGKFKLFKDSLNFLSFYKCRHYLDERVADTDFFKKFTNHFQEINEKKIFDKINKNVVTDEELVEYKNVLIKKLNSAAFNNVFFDKTLKIDTRKFYNYSILFDSYSTDFLLDGMDNQFEHSIDKLIYDKFIKNKKIHKEINDKNKDSLIKEITSGKFNFRNGRDFIFYDFGISNEKILEIRKIQECNDSWTPNCFFWKKGSVKFNLICSDEKTQVRRLSRDEINLIIDRDYSQVDGLYKYSDNTSDNRSIFISREELYDLIYKKYFYAIIVFSCEFYVDTKNVLSIYKENEKDE